MWYILTAVLSFLLYSFKLKESLIFHPDLGNDFYNVIKISQGNLTLLGPKFTFGGLHGAPYYYYYLTPAFLIGQSNLVAIHIFNALVFAVSIGYFVKQAAKKYPLWQSLLAGAALALSPLYIFGARNFSNATSYMAIFIMMFSYMYFNKSHKKWVLTTLGFLLGVTSNFDFVTFLVFPSIFLLLWPNLKKKKDALYFFLGIVAAFFPLLLFELKNNFIMFRNTFIQKSYLSWIENKNMGAAKGGKQNILESMFFMAGHLKGYLAVNPLIPFVGFGAFISSKHFQNKTRLLFYGAALSFIILSVLIRFQFALHYLFPTGIFLLFAFIILMLETRFTFLLILFLILELYNFPKLQYAPSYRSPDAFEQAVKYSIENKLVDKSSNFNLVQVTDPSFLAMLGFEYRSFFQKYGYAVRSEFEFSDSDVLLVFTDIPTTNPETIRSWEIDQFGTQHLKNAKKYQSGKITIYKIVK